MIRRRPGRHLWGYVIVLRDVTTQRKGDAIPAHMDQLIAQFEKIKFGQYEAEIDAVGK